MNKGLSKIHEKEQKNTIKYNVIRETLLDLLDNNREILNNIYFKTRSNSNNYILPKKVRGTIINFMIMDMEVYISNIKNEETLLSFFKKYDLFMYYDPFKKHVNEILSAIQIQKIFRGYKFRSKNFYNMLPELMHPNSKYMKQKYNKWHKRYN